MPDKKCLVMGITGGIAAYKACEVASALTKSGVEVHVIMTKNATEFVSPMTFETLTGNRVSTDTFDRSFEWHVGHVALAKKADVFLIAPASANIIAKMASGIADDMLSTTVLAAGCKKLVAPAMNTGMLMNPATQRNLETLRGDGCVIIDPASGRLACGDIGAGRLAEVGTIIAAVEDALCERSDLAGRRVLVTAGPTREAIDPVRYITNRSTGKMGYAMAKAAHMRGAEVLLITGPTELPAPFGVAVLRVESAEQMYDAVLREAEQADIIIKAAAVADYTPEKPAAEKIKKSASNMTLSLLKTRDILLELGGKKRESQLICGFSMETESLLENSRKKLLAKNADMIVANSIVEPGAGFAGDTNVAVLITKNGERRCPLMAKEALAQIIFDELLKLEEKE